MLTAGHPIRLPMRTFYILSVLNLLPCALYLTHHPVAQTFELFTACFLLDSFCSWVDCQIVFAVEPFMPVQDIKGKRLFELPIASLISILFLCKIRFNSAIPSIRIHYEYCFWQNKDFEKPSFWVSAFNLSES